MLKIRSFLKKFFILFYALFASLSIYAKSEQDSDTTKITIESAQRTDYRKNKELGTEEIVLSGNVVISVAKGKTSTKITADSVTFNRASEMLYASGNVKLEQTGTSEGGQTITAESLLFNTSTLEGIFDDGRAVQTQSDAINLPSGSTLIVHSNIFGRSSSNTIAFKNAELTFCDDEDPHWKIWASRIWLLPGGEFAFFNAVLFVGHFPLMYLPAFYYPKDELIFNPTFGYDDRLGYFFQTTTYLVGRKPLDTTKDASADDDITKGLFNFMKASRLKEQVREGLVLHNLDEDYTGSTSNYVKFMADYYTNLGFMVGIDAVTKPSKILSSFDGSVRLGFSNTIFEDGNVYTDFYENKNWSDSSNFMGFELPFRYGASLNLSFSKPFSFSLSMPVYSDPYFKQDFGERSEYIDWLGFIMGGDEEEEEKSTSTVSSFTWQIDGSYSFPVPECIKPYVSSWGISNLSSSISFNAKNRVADAVKDPDWNEADGSWRAYSPERSFYFPSQVKPFRISGSIAGTLVSYPKSKNKKTAASPKFPVPLDVPDEFLTEEELQKKKEELEKKQKETSENTTESESDSDSDKEKQESGSESESSEEEKTLLADDAIPVLASSVSGSATDFKGLEYSLSYSVSPQYESEISYNSNEIYKPEDFEWWDINSSYYQVKVPASLTSKLSYRANFATMSNSFSFNPVFQKHPNLNGYTDSQAATVTKTDYAAKKLDLTNSNSVSIKPFVYSPVFKNTSLDWNTSIRVIQTEFLGDVDHPEWKYKLADLTDSDYLTTHTLSATLSAQEGDYSQSLTLSTKLPPQLDYYYGTLKFAFPLASLSFASGFEQKSKDDETLVKLPFQQSATLKLFSNQLTLSESFNYKLEDWYIDSFKLSASYSNFQLSYVMSYTYGYDFSSGGWNIRSDKEFLPYSLSLSYSTSGKTYYKWSNRISFAPTISSSIVYDCLRPTNSYFTFVPTLNFRVNDFITISLSAETKNSVIFRYVQEYTDYGDVIGGETNPLIDLYNSFKFWGNGSLYDEDQESRKASGFKMKTFKISVTHSLHDWDLAASLSFKPRTISKDSKKEYDYSPYFTLGVTWRPMASMRTEIVDEYGEWKLNP
ncbi:MAG: LPS-assembly protein LptD [Treponema sp.]|nr:LPS-assembly protein LptD [Treponema sp.]